MVNKLYLSLLLLVIPLYTSFAQNLSEGFGGNAGNVIRFQAGSDNINLNYSEFEGNPFLNEGWITGNLFLRDGTEFNNVPLMYNIYNNQLIARQNGQPVVLYNNLIKGFKSIETNNYYSTGYHSEKYNLVRSEFVKEIFANEDLAIIEIYDVEIFEDQADGYSSMTNTKRFAKSSTIAIKTDGEFEKLKFKEKKILKALPYPKNKIEKIAKENSWKIDDEDDLKLILDAYTSQYLKNK